MMKSTTTKFLSGRALGAAVAAFEREDSGIKESTSPRSEEWSRPAWHVGSVMCGRYLETERNERERETEIEKRRKMESRRNIFDRLGRTLWTGHQDRSI
jgi:hypothetical protein